MPKPKHPNLTGAALRDAIAQAARCRAARFHRLEVIPSDPEYRPEFGSLITFRCELCGTIRRDIVQRRTGRLLNRYYDPPEWYTATNEDRQDAAWWRVKWWDMLDDALILDAEEKVVPIRRRKTG